MKKRNQEEMMAKMREIALQNPENIRIIETSVDADLQIEFFETLQRLADIDEEYNIEALYSELNCDETALDRKKDILATLTSLGEVESFRLLEDYLKIANDEIKTWAFLACQQGRMFLESKLLEESKIYIASGLGGSDYKLRYIFAFASVNEDFSESQKGVVTGEIEYFLKKNEAEIENVEFLNKYVVCTALVPLYVDLVELMQQIVEEINQYGGFLHENVFLTNEKMVTVLELNEIFDK